MKLISRPLIKGTLYLLEGLVGTGIGILIVILLFNFYPWIDLLGGILLGILILSASIILGIYLIGLIYVKLYLPDHDMISGIFGGIIGLLLGAPFTYLVADILNEKFSWLGALIVLSLIFPIIGAVIGFNLGLRNTSK